LSGSIWDAFLPATAAGEEAFILDISVGDPNEPALANLIGGEHPQGSIHNIQTSSFQIKYFLVCEHLRIYPEF